MATKVTSKRTYSHRDDAEWLTKEICTEFYNRARELKLGAEDITEHRKLRRELQYRCDIDEIEAINILNGFHADDYVRKYEHEKAVIDGTVVVDEEKEGRKRREFLKWLDDIDTKKKDDGWKIDD